MTQTMTRQQEERRMMDYGYASWSDYDRSAAIEIIAKDMGWRWYARSYEGTTVGWWINPDPTANQSRTPVDMATAALSALKLYTAVTVEQIQERGSELRRKEFENAYATR